MEENEQSVVIQSDKKGFGIAGLILGVVCIVWGLCFGGFFSVGLRSDVSVLRSNHRHRM